MSFEIAATTQYKDVSWLQEIIVVPGPPYEACMLGSTENRAPPGVKLGRSLKNVARFQLRDKNCNPDKPKTTKGNVCRLQDVKKIKAEAYNVRMAGWKRSGMYL
jgi:hypothetical protein